jgi:hypothetical protein
MAVPTGAGWAKRSRRVWLAVTHQVRYAGVGETLQDDGNFLRRSRNDVAEGQG